MFLATPTLFQRIEDERVDFYDNRAKQPNTLQFNFSFITIFLIFTADD